MLKMTFRYVPMPKRLDIVNKLIWELELGNVEAIPLLPEEVERTTIGRDAKTHWKRLV